MGAGRRIEMAKEAVAKVIDTLTWSDHGGFRNNLSISLSLSLSSPLPFTVSPSSVLSLPPFAVAGKVFLTDRSRCIHHIGSLVLFDDSTVTYECEDGGIMCAMTKEEKDLMKDWAS